VTAAQEAAGSPLRSFLLENEVGRNLAASLALLVAVLVLRAVAQRWVRSTPWPSDELRLRWHARIGQGVFLFSLLGLLVIWAPELRAFAFSAAAVAAALVLATKELIMCASGSLLRAAGDVYQIGDRIEIDGLRGDVIRLGILTTTLLEVGPAQQRTGRAIALPNSLLLSKPLVNETFTEEYVLHSFPVPLRAGQDWRAAERLLLAAAAEVCAEHIEAARASMERESSAYGLSPPSVEPRVALQMPAADELRLLVRIPAPARHKGRLEQEILARYLDAMAPAGSPQAGQAGQPPPPPRARSAS